MAARRADRGGRDVRPAVARTLRARDDADITREPGLFTRLKAIGRGLKRELDVYRLVLAHQRTPRLARWPLGLAIGYALLPFDGMPGFIPALGHLYDVVIVPALVWLAARLIPAGVVAECRRQVSDGSQTWPGAAGGRERFGIYI